MIPQEDKTELTKLLEEKRIAFTPSIELRIDHLVNIPLMELEMNNKDGVYNQVRRAIKPIVNYGWDNSILKVSNIFGDLFSIHIHLRKVKGIRDGWEITLWDYKGHTVVGSWYKKYEGDEDKLTQEEIKPMKDRLEEFTRNVLHCSDCQTTMPTNKRIRFNSDVHKEDYGGQYFAGHYCIKCWERKWKGIEAKETYD